MDTDGNVWIIMNTLMETYEQICNLQSLMNPYVEDGNFYFLLKKVGTIFPHP